jgi:hypothetical protein
MRKPRGGKVTIAQIELSSVLLAVSKSGVEPGILMGQTQIFVDDR